MARAEKTTLTVDQETDAPEILLEAKESGLAIRKLDAEIAKVQEKLKGLKADREELIDGLVGTVVDGKQVVIEFGDKDEPTPRPKPGARPVRP